MMMTSHEIEKTSLKIAIPTNDRKTVFSGMLGRAEFFEIYELRVDYSVHFIECRENPYEQTLQKLKTLDVYKLIDDCSLIISTRIGKKGVERLLDRGMKLIYESGDIGEALQSSIDVLRDRLYWST